MSILKTIEELYAEIDTEKLELGQNRAEFSTFLEFVAAYFRDRDIWRPVVVELGIYDNCQKRFYEQLMNAEYIGVDIGFRNRLTCVPDIRGNTHSPKTVEELGRRLSGRPIDLLFIDADHTYESVKKDYEIYGPLTKHIIAFHDISTIQWTPDIPVNVIKFWEELSQENKKDIFLTIKNFNTEDMFSGQQMGIGVVIKT